MKDYEGVYSVSCRGRVRRRKGTPGCRAGRIIRPKKDKAGYLLVNLCMDGKVVTRKVHRLVAEAFIPNPENKPTVNHKNGVKSDNRVENLEWCTPREQNLHAYKVLRRKVGITLGESHGRSTLTENDVRAIRRRLREGFSKTDIGKTFGVSRTVIRQIETGRTWTHVKG